MRILGISRGIDYSPNLVGDDAAIFTAVIDELRHLGHEVITIREEEMRKQDYSSFDRVMTMARNRATLTVINAIRLFVLVVFTVFPVIIPPMTALSSSFTFGISSPSAGIKSAVFSGNLSAGIYNTYLDPLDPMYARKAACKPLVFPMGHTSICHCK